MGIALKGIEIENFKSYTTKQYIQFSDLAVLLGANSSGKSTALQALLVLKQTMECNSPDEELLLSGKYVALGDYDDVISNPEEDVFSFSVVLGQTEKTESTLEDDDFRIQWNFKRDEDGISASLYCVEVYYENMRLTLKREYNELYNLYINEKRSEFSVYVHNLRLSNYVVHYDKELNRKASDLVNDLLQTLISLKTTKMPTEKHFGADAISEFYHKLITRVQDDDSSQNPLTDDIEELAIRIEKLVDEFNVLDLSTYNSLSNIFSREIRIKILKLALVNSKTLDKLDAILEKYESYILEYKRHIPEVSELEGIYPLGMDPFWGLDREDKKSNNLTQLKYALDFYNSFYTDIISEMFFVGPIRETPKGLYNIGFETIPKYVGPTGAYFASVLLHEGKKEKEYILPRGKDVCTLSDALAEWMMHLNVASSVNVDKKNSFGFSVSIENMDQVRSDIMNVGIGTSQVLPVLISVLLSEPHEILIFEQPELHLHPYSQSRLADLFVEFCKHGRKVILETHSEYFLLRLRYHIVKGNYAKESAAINFFSNMSGTKVETANISGFGNIEYPKDFRDETQELLDSILEAALERKGI